MLRIPYNSNINVFQLYLSRFEVYKFFDKLVLPVIGEVAACVDVAVTDLVLDDEFVIGVVLVAKWIKNKHIIVIVIIITIIIYCLFVYLFLPFIDVQVICIWMQDSKIKMVFAELNNRPRINGEDKI